MATKLIGWTGDLSTAIGRTGRIFCTHRSERRTASLVTSGCFTQALGTNGIGGAIAIDLTANLNEYLENLRIFGSFRIGNRQTKGYFLSHVAL